MRLVACVGAILVSVVWCGVDAEEGYGVKSSQTWALQSV